MANTTFQGPVISKKGFYNTGPANVIDADSDTSLTVATHAGRIVHNDAAGAVTYTLPAVNATADSGIAGPGPSLDNLSNVGATFTIISSITKTGSLIVQVANSTDVMTGMATMVDTDTTDNMEGFMTVAASDTITLNGTTSGGLTHATIVCTVLATGLWTVSVRTGGTVNLVTPFSAAV